MSATSRLLLDPAPGGLFLLQDLVNTRAIPSYGVRDLLATVHDAQRWTRTTVPAWREATGATGTVGRLRSGDLRPLARLRDDLVTAVEGRAVRVRRPAEVVHEAGVARLQPVGTGVAWLASAVWGQVLLSRLDGSWQRLKVCAADGCPAAFHDRSRNNSRVWHDVHTCGNVANLRASRARRR